MMDVTSHVCVLHMDNVFVVIILNMPHFKYDLELSLLEKTWTG